MRHLWLFSFVFLSACATGSRHAQNQEGRSDPAILSEVDTSRFDQLVVVGTNDFHGYLRTVESKLGDETVLIGGAEWFAGYVNILERKYGDSLILLDGGDMWQGTMDSNTFLGRSVVEFYNLLPYRAVAVGNHEFDYGPEKKGGKDLLGAAKANFAASSFPYVQANIFWKGTNKLWKEKNLQPSVMVEAGGYKVGIIGLTTTSTPGKTLPKFVEKLEFRDFVQPTLEQAKLLRGRGAEIVLIAMHEGEGLPGDPVYNLLHALPKGTIDGVVSGHSHTEQHHLVNGVPVIQSKTRGLFFGRFDLFVDKETRKVVPSLTKLHGMHMICGTWLKGQRSCDQKAAKDSIEAKKASLSDFLPLRTPFYEGEEVKPDPSVQGAMAPFFAKVDRKKKEVLGQAVADFDWYPTGENQMGTLILDAYRFRFPEAKVIVMNGGGIRRRLFKGPITYGDLYELSPFDNVAVLVKMTGRQLREMMKPLFSGEHKVPLVWGIKVRFFNRVDSAFDRDVNGDGKNEQWERDRLDPVNGLVWEENNKPVGDEEEFLVATLDYLVAGGDHLEHVFGPIPLTKRKYFEMGPRDLVAEYLRKNPGIVVPRTDVTRLFPVVGAGASNSQEH
jgi:5'-nucleotidase